MAENSCEEKRKKFLEEVQVNGEKSYGIPRVRLNYMDISPIKPTKSKFRISSAHIAAVDKSIRRKAERNAQELNGSWIASKDIVVR